MSEFLAMDGYGTYVWSAFGLSALVFAVNTVWALRRLRAALHAPVTDAAPAPTPVVVEEGQ